MLDPLTRKVIKYEIMIKETIGPVTYYATEIMDIYYLVNAEPDELDKIKRAVYERCAMKLTRIIRAAMPNNLPETAMVNELKGISDKVEAMFDEFNKDRD